MTEDESQKPPQVPKNTQPPPSDPGMDALPYSGAIDRGPEVVATTLAPQLGSNAQYLGKGDFDMRKLSVITEKDIPFLIYAKIRGKKTDTWNSIFDMYLNLQVSVNGRGRRDIIRMEGVSKGGLPDMQMEEEKPGWLTRNVTNRKWQDKQREEAI